MVWWQGKPSPFYCFPPTSKYRKSFSVGRESWLPLLQSSHGLTGLGLARGHLHRSIAEAARHYGLAQGSIFWWCAG